MSIAAKLKIVFMGTPEFARIALEAICERTHHDVIAVYSQPPRPKGRGHKLQKSPVHDYAQTQNIEVHTRQNLKGAQDQEAFAALEADITIVAAYGLLLPKAILDAPKYGCVNIHASLLPRWRGASPIQQAILAGDKQSGVTLMHMDEGLDTGAMISKSHAPITDQTTASMLHDVLAVQGGDLIVELLEQIAEKAQTPEATAQNDADTTYAPLLKKQDGVIDWTQNAAQIDRQIRALNPWPGVKSGDLKCLKAAVGQAGTEAAAGTILDRTGHIACGEGTTLQLLQLQPAGKKPMDIGAALNGGYLKIGDRFL